MISRGIRKEREREKETSIACLLLGLEPATLPGINWQPFGTALNQLSHTSPGPLYIY